MKNILITGGTVFVSKAIAEFYVAKGYNVYVLNRGTKQQPVGTTLIKADRYDLGSILKDLHFDIVVDTAYKTEEVELLIKAMGSFNDYVFISSSAVYPEHEKQPFKETTPVGFNSIWKGYGQDKIEAESRLLELVPHAYILRPAYIYGPGNNVYREAFVFDCANDNRPFYLPQDGSLNLQFYHIDDLCKLVDALITLKPEGNIVNAGNPESISAKEWVRLCYEACGKTPQFVEVNDVPNKYFFSFSEYEYMLDVSLQQSLHPHPIPLEKGIKESLKWYLENEDYVQKRDYQGYIDLEIKK